MVILIVMLLIAGKAGEVVEQNRHQQESLQWSVNLPIYMNDFIALRYEATHEPSCTSTATATAINRLDRYSQCGIHIPDPDLS
jgi:hypothetical protein